MRTGTIVLQLYLLLSIQPSYVCGCGFYNIGGWSSKIELIAVTSLWPVASSVTCYFISLLSLM